MKVNLHAHTYLCSHATGTPEEYVKRAIENGIKVMGFSEHVPFVFPNEKELGSHLQMKDAPLYFETIKNLREKYKEQIDIRIGFEVEYLPKYFNKMYNQCVEMGAEYFLLGQHFVGNEEPWGHWIGQYVRPKEDLTEYVDLAVEAMKTGKFTYFCHPDVIDATDDMDFYIKENTRLCEAAKEYGVPLEINFYGIRDNRFYPYDKFWEIAGRVGCKVVYGFDSHDVEAAFDRASIPAADELVRKYGLKLVENPEIVKLY